MVVTLPNGFTPRWYQREFMGFFDAGGRRSIEVWHRRSGKDLTAMHQACKMAHRRRGLYWHIFPTEAQGRKALWQGFTRDSQRLMELVFPRAIRRSPREWTPNAQMVVELHCGSIWRLIGSDRIENVGAGPAGVTFSEFALAKPGGWDYVRPMLRENDGWATFLTTPRGKNHAFKMWEMAGNAPGWRRALLGLKDTGAFPYEQTIAEERAEGMPEELIDQEYNCTWEGALVGSYYGELLRQLEARGGLRAFEHPPGDVFTCWDLGHDDSTAIWWWRLSDVPGGGVEFLDHYESHTKPMSHYFQVVRERPWPVKKHWLPHDATATTLQTGRSILDMAIDEWGPSRVEIVPDIGLQAGIQAVRALLQRPGTRFHPRCSKTSGPADSDGVECLRAYRKKWNDVLKCFSAEPVHDWASHCFTGDTLVLTRHGMRQMMRLPKSGEVLTPCGWSRYRNPRKTLRNAQLVRVTFDDGLTVRCTPEHKFLTVRGWRSAASLRKGSVIQSSLTPSRSTSGGRSTDSSPPIRTSGTRKRCIETYGPPHSAPFRRGATSTTRTRTSPTTASTTSSASRAGSTTAVRGQSAEPRELSRRSHRKCGRSPQRGIGAKRVGCGISGRRSRPPRGRSGNVEIESATTAGGSSRRSSETKRSRTDSAGPTARPLRIASVEWLSERADVWDITVPGHECFSLANGAVVHNSADATRYVAVVDKITESMTKPLPPREARKVRLVQEVGLEEMFQDRENRSGGRGRL